jgi:peptide methionine sulfoxide reductase msrA/msrB
MKFIKMFLLMILGWCLFGGLSSMSQTQAQQAGYKKPNAEELKKRLSAEQYTCTQEEGTEKPFQNAYWNNHDDGLYVDVVSGEALFSSLDKYDSGTGWPSFTQPISDTSLTAKPDHKMGRVRTEIRSAKADSHLGHVFDDGPGPTRKRFCINSASLKFIPLKEMKEKGYGHYLFPFAQKHHWQIATLSGGCFWGMEELLRQQKGVIETQAGYTGGTLDKALYEQVKTGITGHAESVRVLFDPKVLSYRDLLYYFFKIHDPTTVDQQGNDVGTQYRSEIFTHDKEQEQIAKEVILQVNQSKVLKGPVVTKIEAVKTFWPAEDYHQKYLIKNPKGYTCHFVRNLDFRGSR